MLTCVAICCQDTVIQNIAIAWESVISKRKEKGGNMLWSFQQSARLSISCCKIIFLFHGCKQQIKKMGRAKQMEKVFSFSLWTDLNLKEGWHMKMAVSTTKFPEIFHLKYILTTRVFSTSWADTTVLVLNFSEVCSLRQREHMIKFRC